MAIAETRQMNAWKQFRNDLLGEDAITELVSGNHMTVCRYTINNKVKVASHSHEYEQISLVLRGKMLLTVGDETISMQAGDVQVIPSRVKHSSEIIDTPFQTIESFSPVRVDFLGKLKNDEPAKSPKNPTK